MRRATLISVLATASLLAAVPAGAGAARTEIEPAVVEASPEGAAREVSIYIPSPTDHRRILELRLYPAKGVAVVDTYLSASGTKPARGVAYAIAIPPAPFYGSLDLNFPGLGEFVGTVTSEPST